MPLCHINVAREHGMHTGPKIKCDFSDLRTLFLILVVATIVKFSYSALANQASTSYHNHNKAGTVSHSLCLGGGQNSNSALILL